MTFQEAIKSGFKNYAVFSGRASRSEYWYWFLFSVIVGAVTLTIDTHLPGFDPRDPIHPINTVASIVTFLPGLGLAIRRLHDVNRSGWWLLLLFTFIGVFFPLLYWDCKKGTTGENRFGSDPLARE